MADNSFLDFNLKTPDTADFLVGYNADGSTEYKTNVSQVLSLASAYTLSGNSVNWNTAFNRSTVFSSVSSRYDSSSTVVESNSANWNRAANVATIVQNSSASWEESADILPTVTRYLSTSNVTMSSITFNGSFIGATSATAIGIGSLSARTFTLVHDPANDGVDPIFDIGETRTGSFSGFRIRYEEPTNRFIGSSRTGTTTLTSFIINTATGQVGISGLPLTGQALTVIGNISAAVINTPGGTSDLWNAASSLVRANSASWEESSDIIPTVTNYLSTSNVAISSLRVTNYQVSATTSSNIIFTDTDSGRAFNFNTTTTPAITAQFPGSLLNGFNVSIVNVGTGSIYLSAGSPLNASGTENNTPYSGMFIYKTNNELFGVGVFV
jgi:hypothetical protein